MLKFSGFVGLTSCLGRKGERIPFHNDEAHVQGVATQQQRPKASHTLCVAHTSKRTVCVKDSLAKANLNSTKTHSNNAKATPAAGNKERRL